MPDRTCLTGIFGPREAIRSGMQAGTCAPAAEIEAIGYQEAWPGGDVTVVATSYMVQRSLKVADQMAQEGIQVEVVDPRTLVPLDFETLMASVEKTRRVVIVDETHHSCGVAAELAARIWESGYDRLKAPVRRVDTADVPIPYNKAMEEFISPSESRIAEAVRALVR